MQAGELLTFWFDDAASRLWFRSTPGFDAEIKKRFESTWRGATEGLLSDWEKDPRGALALVILLDQFPLNMFRDRPQSFASEALSRDVAARAIARGFDAALDEREKAFLYLPFMHSENMTDQNRSVALFEAAGMQDNLRWARHHREIVRRFGRFPHRNVILGRTSTAEEADWLDSPGAFKP